MAKNRNRLIELLDDGALDADRLARDLLGYLSDDDCEDFAHKNDIELFPDDDDPEEFEIEDEDEVREAFANHWAECLKHKPELANDKPARYESFALFVDNLQREGRISEDLASEVTLEDD